MIMIKLIFRIASLIAVLFIFTSGCVKFMQNWLISLFFFIKAMLSLTDLFSVSYHHSNCWHSVVVLFLVSFSICVANWTVGIVLDVALLFFSGFLLSYSFHILQSKPRHLKATFNCPLVYSIYHQAPSAISSSETLMPSALSCNIVENIGLPRRKLRRFQLIQVNLNYEDWGFENYFWTMSAFLITSPKIRMFLGLEIFLLTLREWTIPKMTRSVFGAYLCL